MCLIYTLRRFLHLDTPRYHSSKTPKKAQSGTIHLEGLAWWTTASNPRQRRLTGFRLPPKVADKQLHRHCCSFRGVVMMNGNADR